jgi:hypothetical protein
MLCLQDRHSFFFASPLPSTLVGKDSQPGRLGDLLGMERIQSWPSASGGAAVAPRKVKERNGSVFPEVRRVPPNSIKMNEPESRQCKLVLPGSSDEEVVVPRASEAGDVLPAAAGGDTEWCVCFFSFSSFSSTISSFSSSTTRGHASEHERVPPCTRGYPVVSLGDVGGAQGDGYVDG